MKIAVVGCGAVGSYYGARLARDGHETHFLLRSDYDVVRRQGVRIRSPQGDFSVRPKVARRPEEIGPADLVMIGLKSTANHEFAGLLPPLVAPRTAVLTLQNGLGNEDQLARLFPPGQILGGLCFVCLNRVEPGIIQHIDHGLVVIGEYSGWPEPRTHDLASAFRHAGISCNVTDNLARAHWEKLIWNIPFNGLGVAGAAGFEAFDEGSAPPQPIERKGIPTDQLLADEKWSRCVRELMLEVIAIARKQGLQLPERLAKKNIERTRTMGPYKASTLIDFERNQPLELESLFLTPLRIAQQSGVDTPRLAALCRILQQL